MSSINIKVIIVTVLFTIVTLLFPKFANAQDEYRGTIFATTQAGLLNSVELPAKNELKMIIGHRFGEMSGGLYEFFGLDQATTELGLDWGATDWLGIYASRSTWEKTYELNTKLALIRREFGDYQFAATTLLGGSVNTLRDYYPEEEENFWSRTSLSAQIILAVKRGRFALQTSPLLFRNNYEIRTDDQLTLFALPVVAGVNITKRMGILVEYVAIFNKPDFSDINPLTFTIEMDTGGHQFQLLFSSSQGLTHKTILTNNQGGWAEGSIFFGFNLVRTFYL